MKMIQAPLAIVLLLVLHGPIKAQITITPLITDPQFVAMEQLFHVLIQNNNSESQNLKIVLNIRDENSVLMSRQSFPIHIEAYSLIGPTELSWRPIQFFDRQFESALESQGLLPAGDYELLYSVFAYDLGEQVATYENTISMPGIGPPELLYPGNQQVLKEVHLLNWRAPIIGTYCPIRYYIRLCKINSGQNKIDALMNNIPIIERILTDITTMDFPTQIYTPKEGDSFVWQCEAKCGNKSLGQTEIWTFEIDEDHISNDPENITESFRALKEQWDGSTYDFQDTVYLSYDNRMYQSELNLVVSGIGESNTDQLIKTIQLDIKPGLNLIKLPASELDLYSNGRYQLTSFSGNKPELFLHFNLNLQDE